MGSFSWLHMFKLYPMSLALIFILPSASTQVWDQDFDSQNFLRKIPVN